MMMSSRQHASMTAFLSWLLFSLTVTRITAAPATIDNAFEEAVGERGNIQRIFTGCDPATYYEDAKNGMDWDRVSVATLLTKTHRQIVPLSSENEEGDPSLRSIIGAPTTSTSISAWDALQDLDKGEGRSNGSISTVKMMFTGTEMDASQMQNGWEPGQLWYIQDNDSESEGITTATTTTPTSDTDDRFEMQAAMSDLHNLRPRHPSIYHDDALHSIYYGNCFECFQDNSDGNVDGQDALFHNTRNGVNDGKDRVNTGNGGSNTARDSASRQDLCLCSEEHALQPPEAARGEIARALLYMDLRYGTPTTASDGLGLFLSDCHPLSALKDPTTNRMGYFSRLVQWHLEYPPTEAEMERNSKICQLYQGNRNPFVDFYEDSWSLLNFEVVDQEECLVIPVTEQDSEEEESGRVDGENEDQDSINVNDGICDSFMAGDVNFNMVDAPNNSFGLVTLMDLPAGFELYVTNNAWLGSGFDTTGGVVKLVIPDGGMPAIKAFGFGDLLYLGNSWEQTIGSNSSPFALSGGGDQLFLYCSLEGNPNVLAALSTTGQAFASLPDSLQHGYGVIVLPQDASSKRYRYVGPLYQVQDMYAKALIDVANWRSISSSSGGLTTPTELSTNEQSPVTMEDESESVAETPPSGETEIVILPPRQSGASTRTATLAMVVSVASMALSLWLS